MTLGEKIYKLRTEKGLSQGDLSEMLEVSRQSISKWENDGAKPDLDKIIKLSEIFGITIDELVKSEEVSFFENPKTSSVIIKKESNFPPRKIFGTVLLSLSVVIMFICAAIGVIEGALAGILFSSPLILCGIICFVFRKNIGLWCGWAVFFCVDMYLRIATGTNYSIMLSFKALLFYIRGGEFLRLALVFIQFAAIASLIFITVFRFRKIPLEKKKLPIAFWTVFVFMKIALAVFTASPLYLKVMHNLLATAEVWGYSVFHSIYVWIYSGFFVAAVVFTVRYFYTKKTK